MENLDRMAGDQCGAVVTGQQVGLYTGPAYTIYKALTAIKLAESYRRSGVEAVPVFWMATEDHDLDEVCRTWILAADSTLRSVQFTQKSEENRLPVGPIPFDSSIQRPPLPVPAGFAGLRIQARAGRPVEAGISGGEHLWAGVRRSRFLSLFRVRAHPAGSAGSDS